MVHGKSVRCVPVEPKELFKTENFLLTVQQIVFFFLSLKILHSTLRAHPGLNSISFAIGAHSDRN